MLCSVTHPNSSAAEEVPYPGILSFFCDFPDDHVWGGKLIRFTLAASRAFMQGVRFHTIDLVATVGAWQRRAAL